MRTIHRRVVGSIIVVSALSSSVGGADPGQQLAVVQVGDGSAVPTSASTAVFIDKFTQTGTPTTTIALSEGTDPVTLSGTATSEGSLRISADGRYLTLAGYATAPGATTSVASSTSLAVNRVVVRIDQNANVDTTTHLVSAYSANNIRGAVTDDGTRFWTTGPNGSGGTNGGLQFVTFGPSASATQLTATPTNTRASGIFFGQLYFSSMTGAFVGVTSVGTGLPTSSGQTSTLLSGFPDASTESAYGFMLFDMDSTVPGPDRLYIADDRAPASGGGSRNGPSTARRGLSQPRSCRAPLWGHAV